MRIVQIKQDDRRHKSDITIALKSATVKKFFLKQKNALHFSVPCVCGPNASQGEEQPEAWDTPSTGCEKQGTILPLDLTKNSIFIGSYNVLDWKTP